MGLLLQFLKRLSCLEKLAQFASVWNLASHLEKWWVLGTLQANRCCLMRIKATQCVYKYIRWCAHTPQFKEQRPDKRKCCPVKERNNNGSQQEEEQPTTRATNSSLSVLAVMQASKKRNQCEAAPRLHHHNNVGQSLKCSCRHGRRNVKPNNYLHNFRKKGPF